MSKKELEKRVKELEQQLAEFYNNNDKSEEKETEICKAKKYILVLYHMSRKKDIFKEIGPYYDKKRLKKALEYFSTVNKDKNLVAEIRVYNGTICGYDDIINIESDKEAIKRVINGIAYYEVMDLPETWFGISVLSFEYNLMQDIIKLCPQIIEVKELKHPYLAEKYCDDEDKENVMIKFIKDLLRTMAIYYNFNPTKEQMQEILDKYNLDYTARDDLICW